MPLQCVLITADEYLRQTVINKLEACRCRRRKRRAPAERICFSLVRRRVDMYGNQDGSIPASYRVLYFIGWKPDPSQVRQTSICIINSNLSFILVRRVDLESGSQTWFRQCFLQGYRQSSIGDKINLMTTINSLPMFGSILDTFSYSLLTKRNREPRSLGYDTLIIQLSSSFDLVSFSFFFFFSSCFFCSFKEQNPRRTIKEARERKEKKLQNAADDDGDDEQRKKKECWCCKHAQARRKKNAYRSPRTKRKLRRFFSSVECVLKRFLHAVLADSRQYCRCCCLSSATSFHPRVYKKEKNRRKNVSDDDDDDDTGRQQWWCAHGVCCFFSYFVTGWPFVPRVKWKVAVLTKWNEDSVCATKTYRAVSVLISVHCWHSFEFQIISSSSRV